MSEPLLLAIEIGGTKLQLVTARGTSEILDRTQMTVDPQAGATGIQQRLTEAIDALKIRYPWQAVGVGYGGPIDARTGTVCRSFQIGGWSGFPLADWLHSMIAAPVVVENDANAATLGESLAGAGRGFNPVFYTNSGSGVGGGLVIEGRLYHGAIPGEAEFGHLRLDRAGTIVEDRCSGWAVDRKVRDAIKSNPKSRLAQLVQQADHPGGEARFLTPAIAANDEVAKSILDETAADLAFALSHVVHLFHPEVIVLGGGLAMLGPSWRDAVAQHLPRHLMDGFTATVRISELGQQVVPIGALHLAAAAL
jgi:glucokinase